MLLINTIYWHIITCTSDKAQALATPTLMYNIFTYIGNQMLAACIVRPADPADSHKPSQFINCRHHVRCSFSLFFCPVITLALPMNRPLHLLLDYWIYLHSLCIMITRHQHLLLHRLLRLRRLPWTFLLIVPVSAVPEG